MYLAVTCYVIWNGCVEEYHQYDHIIFEWSCNALEEEGNTSKPTLTPNVFPLFQRPLWFATRYVVQKGETSGKWGYTIWT